MEPTGPTEAEDVALCSAEHHNEERLQRAYAVSVAEWSRAWDKFEFKFKLICFANTNMIQERQIGYICDNETTIKTARSR